MVALVVFGVDGCQGRRGPRDAAEPGSFAAGYSAEVRMAFEREGERRRLSGVMAVAAPDSMRLEALDPLGRTRLLAVLARGRSIAVTDEGYLEAGSGQELVARLLQVEVRLAEVVALLLGRLDDAAPMVGVAHRVVARHDDGIPRQVVLELREGGRIVVRLSGVEPLPGTDEAFRWPDVGDMARLDGADLVSVWQREP